MSKSFLGVSEQLTEIVCEKMNQGKGSTYTLDITFTNSSCGIEIKPVKVEGWTIAQNFEQATTDNIVMRCLFFPLDLYNLLSNPQDIKVTIIQTRWDRETYNEDANSEPDEYTFKVFIANPQDLLKQIPPSAITTTDEVPAERSQIHQPLPLDMQLLTDKDYDVIKKKGNVSLADTTVEAAIVYMCNLWDIEKTYIIPPENKKTYFNIMIKPLTGLQDLVPMLQQDYGIYTKGVCSYFCKDTLYVYPPFDTNPDKKEVLNIFKLPENTVDGGDCYHYQECEDTLYITTFASTKTTNSSTTSTENEGNAVTLRQADTSIDVARDVSTDGTVTLNKEAAVIGKVNSSATALSDQVVTNYGGTTLNMYDRLSKLAEGQVETVQVGWIHAKPWLIIPGMKTIIHYDDATQGSCKESFYSTTTGIVKGVQYTLSLQGKPTEYIYRWDASLIVGVPPKEPDENQTQCPYAAK